MFVEQLLGRIYDPPCVRVMLDTQHLRGELDTRWVRGILDEQLIG